MIKLLRSIGVLALLIVALSGVQVFAITETDTAEQEARVKVEEQQRLEAKKAEKAQAAKEAAEAKQKAAQEKARMAEEKAKAVKEQQMTKRSEAKQKTCENHKAALTKKVTALTTAGQKALERIDTIYARALDFQEAKQLESAELTSLVAAADQAKASATASVAALQTTAPVIDCSLTDGRARGEAFQTAGKQARADLQAYRTAVKAYLEALREASVTTDSDEGGAQ